MKSTAVAAACTAASMLCVPCAIGQDHAALHGEVSFPVSCTPEAQRRFNTAASLLYSFQWDRIDQALAEVLDADPDCAMVFWAKAIASLDNSLGSPPTPELEKEGWAAVEKARWLGAKTQRERDYIGAVELFFKDHDTVPFKSRAAAYETALETQLALHPTRGDFDWSPFPEGEAVNAYARGLGAARGGDAQAAKAEIARLTELRAAMVAQRKDYWVEQANVQIDAVAAWVARAEGKNDDALQLMREAANREDQTEKHVMMPGRVIPVREMFGELLLDLDQPALALIAFEQSQQVDPNRFRNVYGAARSAELAGDREKAGEFYTHLLQQVGSKAADRSEIKQAKVFMAKR